MTVQHARDILNAASLGKGTGHVYTHEEAGVLLRLADGDDRSRIDAAAETGRSAATAMVGVVVMLLVAGILEGVGRQSINITGARYAIGGLMLLGWCSYFYLLRARSRFDHG